MKLKSLDLNAALAYAQEDRELLITLIVKYMAVTAQRISQMEQHLTAGSLEEAQKIAHTVRGASGYVGALRMGGLMQEIQTASSLGEVEALMEAIQMEYSTLIAAYQEGLSIDLSAEGSLDAAE